MACSLPVKEFCRLEKQNGNDEFLYAQGNRVMRIGSDVEDSHEWFRCDPQLIVNGFIVVQELPPMIVCYGANLFQVGPAAQQSVERCSDWIITGKAVDMTSVAFLLAHNTVELWQLNGQKKAELIRRISLEHLSIIYSAHLTGDSWTDLIAFSGTVFNQIQVYIPSVTAKCLHQLDGHTGAIFSLRYCNRRHQLYSTSDDRSLKVWQFGTDDLVEGSQPTVDQWKNGRFILRWSLFGHDARVWRSSILSDSVVTHGEDGLVCVWCPETGTLLRKINSGRGSIRSSIATSGCKLLFGTDTGCVFALNVESNTECVKMESNPESKCFTKVMYLAEDLVVAVSIKGDVVATGALQSSQCQSAWVSVVSKDSFVHSSMAKVVKNDEKIVLAVGDMKGLVWLITFAKNSSSGWEFGVKQQQLLDGQILSVIWIKSDTLLICGPSGIAKVCHCDDDFIMGTLANFCIPTGKHRWFTAAVTLESSKDDPHQLWFCGDRNGSLALYQIKIGDNSEAPISPSCLRMKIHGAHGVTDMMRLPSTSTCASQLVLSVGRDGRICRWNLDLTAAKFDLWLDQKLDKNLEWPAQFVDMGTHRLLVGFKSSRFIVYSLANHSAIWELECGGGHRSWSFLNGDDQFHFAFCKDGQIYSCRGSVAVSRDLQPLVHTRRLNGIAIVDADSLLFATVSEDTTVALWRHTKEKKLKVMESLSLHISSVHCVAACHPYVFTAGGRAEICVWRIHEGNETFSTQLIAADKLIDSDARFTGVTAIKQVGNKLIVAVTGSDGVLRIFQLNTTDNSFRLTFQSAPVDSCLMAADIVSLNESFMAVTVATNGKAFLYDVGSNHYDESVIVERQPVVNERFKPGTDGVGMATGVNPIWSADIQKCSLTSVDSQLTEDGAELQLVIGSEDGNVTVLSLCPLELNSNSSSTIKSNSCHHASTVTAVRWVLRDEIASLGSDQRLNIWKAVRTEGLWKLEWWSCHLTYVADPSSFVWLNDPSEAKYKFYISGAGMDVVEVNR